jgi:hypothetical protein
VPIYKVSGLVLAAVVAAVVVSAVASSALPNAVSAKWQGTVLCTTKHGSVARFIGVDDHGQLAAFAIRSLVPPGQTVELSAGKGLRPPAADAPRLLGRATKPLIVHTRLIEDGQTHYRFYRNGHPWGCRVAFEGPATISVAKLLLSRRAALLRVGLRDGRLVHLGPREAPRSDPVEAAKAKADLERFLVLVARGRSIAACALMARGAVLDPDERTGCVMLLESAKFVYRDRYAHATVKSVTLFDLNSDSYALAAIDRRHGTVRVIMMRERGRYRYLRDFEYSPFALW